MKRHSLHARGASSPLIFLVLAAFVLAISWWGIRALAKAEPEKPETAGGGGGMPPANVILDTVESAMSRQTHRVIGTLRAKSRSRLAAREEGAVMEVLVDEGDEVREGDVIARMDPRRLEAQIVESEASVTAARALVSQRIAEQERANTDLKMKEDLFAKKALSESEVLDARRSANVAKALVDAASESLGASQARVSLMKVRRSDLEVRAPFTGKVVERHVELGEWVSSGDPVATLVSTGEIEAWLQVPERFAATVGAGSVVVTLTATGEKVKASRLINVPEADSRSRTLQMIAVLANDSGVMVPGMSVSAELPVTEEKMQLKVPVNAVVQSYAGPGVFLPKEQEGSPLPMAHRLPVEVLYQVNGYAFISSPDLKSGDRVVVEGNERLFPSQPLMIQEPAN